MTRGRDLIWPLLAGTAVESLIFALNLLQPDEQFRSWDWLNALQGPGAGFGKWFGLKVWLLFGTSNIATIHVAQAAGFTTQVGVFTLLFLGIFYCFGLARVKSAN